MAYNNIFPTTYQPVNYQPQQIAQPVTQTPAPQTPQNGPMIWVQGETGAKSYLLAPNTTLPLWDSENQTIYLKSADASGMPSMKILDYTIRDTTSQAAPQVVETLSDFVTHEELEKFEESIKKQIKNINRRGGRTNARSNADAEPAEE